LYEATGRDDAMEIYIIAPIPNLVSGGVGRLTDSAESTRWIFL